VYVFGKLIALSLIVSTPGIESKTSVRYKAPINF